MLYMSSKAVSDLKAKAPVGESCCVLRLSCSHSAEVTALCSLHIGWVCCRRLLRCPLYRALAVRPVVHQKPF